MKHNLYRNEVEKPEQPAQGHMLPGMGTKDFKGEAMDIAYGQASKKGCDADNKKINSQMKDYHWDGNSGY